MECPSCKSPVAAGVNRCPACGAALAGVQGVELREVACWASDVQGLAKLLGQVPTSQVAEYVVECMAALEEACRAHDGTVVGRHSTGLTAVFGAPVAKEREVELATRAAWEARERLAKVASRLYASRGQNLTARLAVDFGLVRVGAYAASDYVALGAPVENAVKLRNNARPNTILLSARAAGQVRSLFKMKPVALGSTAADGRAESGFIVEGFKEGWGAAASRLFVDRGTELEVLKGLLAGLGEGKGAVIGVVGEAGIGKTRLVEEALGGAGDVRVYAGRCLPSTREVSFAVFRDPITKALEGRAGATPLEQAEDLVREYKPELAEAIPLLGVLFDPGGPDAAATDQVRGAARSEKLYELCEAIWGCAAARKATVLLIEDVQWASDADISLLSRLAARAAPLRILLMVTARGPESLRRISAEVVTLAPLGEDYAEELIRGLIPRERLNPKLLRRIVDWARGNPLYCEEIASTVAAGGVGPSFRPPASVKAAARARADRLSPGALTLAKAAACVGVEGDLALVRRVVPPEIAKDFEVFLAELEAAGLAKVGEERLVFVHGVIGDVLYESVVRRERRAKLAEIARAAEAQGAKPGVVAHYLLAAGRNREAVEHLKAAGDHAAASYALVEAISHYRRAWDNLPAAEPREAGLKLELVEKLASALLDYADPGGALELVEGELRYAESPVTRAKLLFLAGRAFTKLGESRKALLFLEDARAVYQELNDPLMEG